MKVYTLFCILIITNIVFSFPKEKTKDTLIDYLIKIEEKAINSRNKKEKCDYYIELADIYGIKNLYSKSLKFYFEAKNNLPEKEYKIIEIENNMAIIFGILGKRKKAAYYFNRVYDRQKILKDNDNTCIVLNNLANLYMKNNDIDSAYYYFKKNIPYIERVKDNNKKSLFYSNLARFYTQIKKYDKAFLLFKKAFLLMDNEMPKTVKSYIYLSYVQYLMNKDSKKNKLEILDYLNNTKKNLIENKYSSQNLFFLELFYSYNKNTKNYKEALNNLLLLKEVKDSLKSIEALKLIDKFEIEAKYKERENTQKINTQKQKFFFLLIIFLFIIFFLLFIIKIIQYKNNTKNARLENEVNIALKKELTAKLELKNKEIVANSLLDIEKMSILEHLIVKLKEAKSQTDKPDVKQFIGNFLNQVEKRITKKNGWEEFEKAFVQVYDSFYIVLEKKHPELTPRDKKICAFIKLNLSTKEISLITGISTKSIENTRTRIRKKLNLTNKDIDLHAYLFNIEQD